MYISDEPIKNIDEDLLGRKNFIDNFAKSIANYNSKDTLCIGLFGKWGYGKTSIINMTIDRVSKYTAHLSKDERIIIFKFNPWDFSDNQQLITQFLIQLAGEFQNKVGKSLAIIGETIEKYSEAIELTRVIPALGSIVADKGRVLLNEIGEGLKSLDITKESNVSAQKDKVIDLLNKQKAKILIIIDDIDRLSNEQIRLIFQLVTSVAKFPNTIYILSFDRDIVVRALEKVQDCDGNEYLEKIIQLPISIPELQKEKLQKILLSNLEEILNQYDGIFFNREYWYKIYDKCVYPFINSLRDIKRLCNTLTFKLSAVYKEVNFTDMVAITTIEIFFPALYEWILNNKSSLIGNNYIPYMTKDKNIVYENYKKSIIKILDNKFYLDLENVIEILCLIFPNFNTILGKSYSYYSADELLRERHIGYKDRFDLYFNLDVDTLYWGSDIINEAFFTLSYNELNKFITDINEKNLLYPFLVELKSIILNLPETRKILFIKILFNNSVQFKDDSKNDILLNTQDYSEFTIRILLNSIDEEKRFNIIKEVISDATKNCFDFFSLFLNVTELAHGRMAANGEKQNYEKLVTIEQLEEIEGIFVDKAKQIMAKTNILDFDNKILIIYLLENLDSTFINEYFNKEYFNSINILRYCALSACLWQGGLNEWEIKKDYQKYISYNEFLDALKNALKNKKFFELNNDTQNRVTAIYLFINGKGKLNNSNLILQNKVDEQITQWKQSFTL